ncbi:hypothetical protein GCM10023063_48740 [Arthrobacter methylotrophus]|uniref:YegP family protein n=1 Tax=Arthrobacter methylotrophus TaxID=121291 RepID=UPI0031EC8744
MKGSIEVYTDNAGFYRFRIKDGNGAVIVTSEAYGSKDEALINLESVQTARFYPVVDLIGLEKTRCRRIPPVPDPCSVAVRMPKHTKRPTHEPHRNTRVFRYFKTL